MGDAGRKEGRSKEGREEDGKAYGKEQSTKESVPICSCLGFLNTSLVMHLVLYRVPFHQG